jgi:hypothetical protein
MSEKWIVADGTTARDASYLVSYKHNTWTDNRNDAMLFESKSKAEEIAIKMDSNAWEVETGNAMQKFTVLAWIR